MSKKLSEHFSEDEFWCRGQDQGTCNCGHSLIIDPKLIELLEKLREITGGLPLYINSGYRCPVHNRAVGGVPNSQHALGTAADVARPSHLSMEEFLWYVQQLPFDGVGVYYFSDFIHCDVRCGSVKAGYFWEG